MRWLFAVLLLAAMPANAAIHISFTGTIDGSTPSPFADDPAFSNIPLLTDTILVTFNISDAYMVDLGSGAAIGGVYYDPKGSMTIKADPFSWNKQADVLDGGYILYDSYASCVDPADPACAAPQILISTPALYFQDGAITGFELMAEPGFALPLAPLISGSGGNFTITQGFYGGALYAGPDYFGHWNFDSAVITTSVPEPAAWLSLIMGFGLTGIALRRRTLFRVALPDTLS